MKIYILKEDVGYYDGDVVKLNARKLTEDKLRAAILKDIKYMYRKGDKFFMSDIVFGNKGQKVYYPVDMLTELRGIFGEPVSGYSSAIMAWKNMLYGINILLQGKKFKSVEDKTIEISPEQRKFLPIIEAEIITCQNSVADINKQLKALKTAEVVLKSRSGVLYTSPAVASSEVSPVVGVEKKKYGTFTLKQIQAFKISSLLDFAKWCAARGGAKVPSSQGKKKTDYKKELVEYFCNHYEAKL